MTARKETNASGFVAVKKGSELYKRTKALYENDGKPMEVEKEEKESSMKVCAKKTEKKQAPSKKKEENKACAKKTQKTRSVESIVASVADVN